MNITLIPGSRFGDYEILGELGGGGMGRVYRAKDRTLERFVALKTLAPQYGKDPSFVQRFLNEARAAARLNHPGIVQIYAFGSVDETYYLAMELVDGRSLGDYLRIRPFPEADAVAVVRHAARALAVAHGAGLVHRDVKPDNIMLTARGEVKLVDLGIAKDLGGGENKALTQTGLAVGTPYYVSPEQARGDRDVDARADVYSLGATLYHLVTGHPPYDGDSGAVVMLKHLVQPLPDPRSWVPELSDGLCRVVSRMMAKEREERYQDLDAVDRDLWRVQTGEEPEAKPVVPTGAGTVAYAPAPKPVAGSAAPAVPTAAPTAAPAQSGPPPVPATPAFDSAVLNRIEDALAGEIGPMAKVLVRRVAKSAPNLEAVCATLSEQVPPGTSREAFRSRCLLVARQSGAAMTPPPAAPPVPAAPPTPAPPASSSAAGRAVTDEDLRALEGELARHVGPLARVLVKKAAKGGAGLADVLATLESEIPDEAGRAKFRAAARKATGR